MITEVFKAFEKAYSGNPEMAIKYLELCVSNFEKMPDFEERSKTFSITDSEFSMYKIIKNWLGNPNRASIQSPFVLADKPHTLKDYFDRQFEKGVIYHAVGTIEKDHYYIRPDGKDGDTYNIKFK